MSFLHDYLDKEGLTGRYGLSEEDMKSAGGLSAMTLDELREALEACNEELTRLNGRGNLKDFRTFYAFDVVKGSIGNLRMAIAMKQSLIN